MHTKAILITALLAAVDARFGQEGAVQDAISGLGAFGNPGDAATLSGASPGVLLGGANPCDKLELADQIVDTLGADPEVIAVAQQLVAAEKNTNPFVAAIPSICADSTLPATAELRGIVPLIDPDTEGSDVQNANSAASLEAPFDADGLSVADVSAAQGFTNFTAVDAAGNDVGVDGREDNADEEADANAGDDAADANADTAADANADDNAADANADEADVNAGEADAKDANANLDKHANAGHKYNNGTAEAETEAEADNEAEAEAEADAGAEAEADGEADANAGHKYNNGTAEAETEAEADNEAEAEADAGAEAEADGEADANAEADDEADAGADANVDDEADADANADAAALQSSIPGADFGSCVPTMAFLPGLGGRPDTEFTFIPQDPLVAEGQQEALNPNIITNRICDQLVNVCGANDVALETCSDAQAQIQAIPVDEAKTIDTADTWNALLGFEGVDASSATV